MPTTELHVGVEHFRDKGSLWRNEGVVLWNSEEEPVAASFKRGVGRAFQNGEPLVQVGLLRLWKERRSRRRTRTRIVAAAAARCAGRVVEFQMNVWVRVLCRLPQLLAKSHDWIGHIAVNVFYV